MRILPLLVLVACSGSSEVASGVVSETGALVLRLGEAEFRLTGETELIGTELRIRYASEEIDRAVTRVYRFEPLGTRFSGDAEVCFDVAAPMTSRILWGEPGMLELLDSRSGTGRVCAEVDHFSIGAAIDSSTDGGVDDGGRGDGGRGDGGPVDAASDADDASDAGVGTTAYRPYACGDPEWDSPATCVTDEECDDRCVCNGAETCSGGVCMAGTIPDCDDGLECTSEYCSEVFPGCVAVPIYSIAPEPEYEPECPQPTPPEPGPGPGPPVPDACEVAEAFAAPGRVSGYYPTGSIVHLDARSDILVHFTGADVDWRAFPVKLWPLASCGVGTAWPGTEAEPLANLDTWRFRDLPPGDYVIELGNTAPQRTHIAKIDVAAPTAQLAPLEVLGECGAESQLLEHLGGPYQRIYQGPGSVHHFRIDIAETSDLILDTSANVTANWRGKFVLSRDCEGTDVVGAVSADDLDGWRFAELPAGTYWLTNNDAVLGAIWWSLDQVYIVDPPVRAPGDSCATAIDITTEPATVSTDDWHANSCGVCLPFGSDPNPDGVFSFEVAERGDVLLTVEGVALAVERGARVWADCFRAEPIEMTDVGGGTLWLRDLEPGDYFVHVDRVDETVTAGVSLETPTVPANDLCSGAIALTDGSSRSDSLLFASDDNDVPGPDVFYQVDLSARSDLAVTADAGTTPVRLSLRASCGGLVTIDTHEGAPAQLAIDLNAGTYFVVVDGPPGTNFDLDATVTPL